MREISHEEDEVEEDGGYGSIMVYLEYGREREREPYRLLAVILAESQRARDLPLSFSYGCAPQGR
jgi:hypothetical protein